MGATNTSRARASATALLEVRRHHDHMDQAVLAAYGWSDALPPASGSTPKISPCG